MLGLWNTVIFLNVLEIFVECSFPSLAVRKLNRQVVARKRQNTLDLCRMFNVENEKAQDELKLNHKRAKRSASLPPNNAEIVENIVDKLYDDEQARGETVAYRKQILNTTDKPQRRFDFAPELLIDLEKAAPDSYEEANKPVPVDWHKYWKHGIVPYFIDSNTYDTFLAGKITKAFDYFEQATCIRLQRLREKPIDKSSLEGVEWLYITNPSGTRQCVHSNEMKKNSGVQWVVFGYDCMAQGEILHEIMHVLGFSHEHIREDRDKHVSVMWENIKPGYKKFFEIKKRPAILTSLPYDFSSVLHYPPRAFSKNGKFTLLAEPQIPFGQRSGLSDIDVEKVSMIFGGECIDRNKHYLVTTCPTVISQAANKDKSQDKPTQQQVHDYFRDRIWPYGIVNYRLKDKIEFSIEERQNIEAVIRHIEKETCIEFRDLSPDDDDVEVTTNLEVADDGNVITLKPDDDKPSVGILPDNTGLSQAEIVDDKDNEIENLLPKPTPKNSETDNDKNDGVIDLKPDSDKTDGVKDPPGAPSSETSTVKIDSIGESPESSEKKSEDDGDKGGKIVVLDGKGKENVASDVNLDSTGGKALQESSKESRRDNGNQTLKAGKQRSGKNEKEVKKRLRRAAPLSPSRRHADDILTLTRSPEPGCRCPQPGRPSAQRELVINADCFNSVNDLLHVFAHVLGLDHQHSMHDRDNFLYINWQNLSSTLRDELKVKLPPAASVGFAYDYQSVTHYPWLDIKDGVTNIMYPIWNDGWAMGHWQGLSSVDVQKLNLLYFEQCQERKKHIAKTSK